jgi:hypothetical protein
VRAGLARERALRVLQLQLQAQPLIGGQRGVLQRTLETRDLEAQLRQLALLRIELPLQVLDAHPLCGDVAQATEPQDGILHPGHRDAKHEERATSVPGRVEVDRRDEAAVAACDAHRLCRGVAELVPLDAHAQPRLVAVQARCARR